MILNFQELCTVETRFDKNGHWGRIVEDYGFSFDPEFCAPVKLY